MSTRLKDLAIPGALQRSLCGGLIFVAFFLSAYARLDGQLYELRDDGIITLSHAKNLVDHGFIGVNPSGERVEGFSAPAQFFTYALAYSVSGLDYATYSALQTLLCTFVLGALFILFFSDGWVRALSVTAIGALILTRYASFLEWHGSGMENAITHVLFLASVLVLFNASRDGVLSLWTVPLVFLATISRTESVYHMAPLLALFSAWWGWRFRSSRGLRFSALVLLLWAGFQGWRYLYFGDFLPNTAYAQDISLRDRLQSLARFDRAFLVESARLGFHIFKNHGGYLLVSLLPGLWFVRRDRSTLILYTLLASLLLTAYLNPFLFGRTRLDPVRSTTHLAVMVALAVAWSLYRIPWTKLGVLALPVSLVLGVGAYRVHKVRPYHVCCGLNNFDRFREEFLEAAREQNLPRPTVSNPDLGVVSWHKQFNIVDLGMLGSRMMARLDSGPVLSDYFFEYAAPDLIESHPYWSCFYLEEIFRDPRFRERYEPIREELRPGPGACTGTQVLFGIWIRKAILEHSGSNERELIDDLRRDLSTKRLRDELAECQSVPARSCVYVARTAYRFLPEFRELGLADTLTDVFSASRTRPFDLYLVQGFRDGRGYAAAADYIARGQETLQSGRLRNLASEFAPNDVPFQ